MVSADPMRALIAIRVEAVDLLRMALKTADSGEIPGIDSGKP